MSEHGTHESFRERDAVKVSSDRSFGVVFAIVFAIIGLLPLIGGDMPRWWALAVAALFMIVVGAAPTLLSPLNWLWTRFGLLLHRIVNPVVMALLFYLVVTPIALTMRLFGKRPLQLEAEPEAPTYWISSDPPGPQPETMKQQF